MIAGGDVDGEVAFYVALGFTAEPTHSGFIALRHGAVLFGVQASARQMPPPDLSWQMRGNDIRAAHDLANQLGLQVQGASSNAEAVTVSWGTAEHLGTEGRPVGVAGNGTAAVHHRCITGAAFGALPRNR